MVKADEQVVEELFVSAARTVEALVTSSTRKGHDAGQLAVIVERRFDGKARVACVERADVIDRVFNDGRIGSADRLSVVELFATAGENHIPVMVIVEAQSHLVVGIRRWSTKARTEAH